MTDKTAGVGPVERGVRPRAWACVWPDEAGCGGGGFVTLDERTALNYMAGAIESADSGIRTCRPALVPLYDQAALDAALALWPRDCRLCAHYRDGLTHAAHCVSVLRCEDSSAYRATQPVQFWEQRPAGDAPF